MGTTTTPNYSLIKPDSSEPATNFPAQTEFNMDKIDTTLNGIESPTNGTYTPNIEATTTDPDLGTGPTQKGRYFELPGGLVYVIFEIRFGSSPSAGSGNYEITLPFEAHADHNVSGAIAQSDVLGTAVLRDNSTLTASVVACQLVSRAAGAGGVAKVRLVQDTGGHVSDSSPWTWIEGDAISGSVLYRKA